MSTTNFYGGSDGGGYYPIPSTTGTPIGYTDGVPFFVSGTHPIPSIESGKKIMGYNYGYMANRREYRNPAAVQSQEKMFDLGINWVCLPVVNWQDTYHSTNIYSDHLATPTDRDVMAFIELSHKRGKKVCLKPIVESKDHMWRAHIGFPDLNMEDMDVYWKAWFISYKNFLLHYAELAQELNVEMFCIGCEMLGTEHRKYDWLYLIDEVRRVYKGKIIYNTNHDHEDDQEWFDALDYIGTSAYYPVGKDGLNKESMIRNWTEIKWRLDAIAAQRNKKYIFMEIGCRSAKNCSTEPWDFNTHMEVDMEEQKLFYETCLEVFTQSSYFAGVFWWDWPTFLYPKEQALTDTSYCVYGKPAEEVLKNFINNMVS